jgi:hypothetical protein
MILENKHRETAKQYTKSLNYPHATKDGTKPYLAKPVKGLVRDYKGNRD